MIEASKLVGHSAAKWSKTQPHEGIWWTNKLRRGVGGADKSYIAYSPLKHRLIYVQQLWDPDDQNIVWKVGTTTKVFDDLNEAKEFAKELLDD
jgi:hypothetical protein